MTADIKLLPLPDDLIERARSEVDLRKMMHGDDRSNWSRADRMMEELLTALEAAREDARKKEGEE